MASITPNLRTRGGRILILTSLIFLITLIYLLPFDSFKSHHATSPFPNTAPTAQPVNWSKFAYIQYVTNSAYLCNSVMLFESLHRMGTKADRFMMYPEKFKVDDKTDEGQLLMKARDIYGAKLKPVEVQHRDSKDSTWAESFTKLLAFNQTQYDRVLGLDSDSVVLKLMDELFFLPQSPVAMPRAYWLDPKDHILSSQIVLIQPSEMEFKRVMKAIDSAEKDDYDMEIFNDLYGDNALIIPHRGYDLLTRAFREDHRKSYLGNDVEEWDPEKVFEEASFLHFSDWPVKKPWIKDEGKIEELKPKCEGDDCRAQVLWMGFYTEFARRRKEICGITVG